MQNKRKYRYQQKDRLEWLPSYNNRKDNRPDGVKEARENDDALAGNERGVPEDLATK